MKLHYIYVLLGIITLALNLALIMHLFRSHKSEVCKETWEGNDLITFRLSREHNAEGVTTAAVPYDDTVPLE
ncbi:MAG: hypothetical protein ACYCYE_13375 [Clostridia bacterium]